MGNGGKPRVAVIGTGGTISSVGKHSLDLVNYGNNNTKYDAVEQVDAFPEVREVAEVDGVVHAKCSMNN